MTDTEAAYWSAFDAYKAAEKAWRHSRSKKRLDAFTEAKKAYDAATSALADREYRESREARAETVARRLALVAPRRELRARQGVLPL